MYKRKRESLRVKDRAIKRDRRRQTSVLGPGETHIKVTGAIFNPIITITLFRGKAKDK